MAEINTEKVKKNIDDAITKLKAAYTEAGGAQGISETTVKAAAELGASAKVLYENIANSQGTKAAVAKVQETAKSAAAKVQETKAFNAAKDEASRLKDVASAAYTEKYASKSAVDHDAPAAE
jgi:hypothetical protein